ncbi:MAG: polysaccharide biosynthesis tyrosine autokinase [Chloroflexota bacterium]
MELRHYLAVVRRWAWLIVLGAVLGAGGAYISSRLTTKVYSASTTLLVNEARSNAMSDYTGLLMSERLAKTYTELLKKDPVLEAVVKNLQLSISPDALGGSINVQSVRDTQLIQLTVESTDPQLAARIANEVPKVFIENNLELQTSRFAASRQNLSNELGNLDAEIKGVQAALDAAKNSSVPGADAERVRLDSKLSELRRSYASVLQSYEQIRVVEAQTLTNVTVVNPAKVPSGPIRPNTTINTLLGLVVGLMLAVGLVFFIEYLDDTLKTADDIQQTLGLTTLGTVLRLPSQERGKLLLAAEQPKSSFAEALRALRTNIQYSSIDKPIKTVLVTSAGPSEGKSTLASNLAVVMAQAGLRTVLIDGDLRRPSVHKIFALNNQRGLTNALVQEPFHLDGDLRLAPTENLKVMTSGPMPPNPSELLGSHRMAALLETLKREADFIVLDSPPTLAVTDASVLASKVDGVILVIDSGSTRRGLALKAKEQLEQVGARILGVAVNKLSARSGGSNYYYYYNYYYSSDEQSPDGARKVHTRRTSHAEAGIGTRLSNIFARFRG